MQNSEIIRKTSIEMFEQRGYNIIEDKEDSIIAIKENGEQVCIFFYNLPKFNIKVVQMYISIIKESDIQHGIIVYNGVITPMAKKVINSTDDISIELFTENELQYNITKHRLVPLHVKVSETEAAGLKKTFGTKFPVLLKSDPVARFYGFNKGDFIKIIRVISEKSEGVCDTHRHLVQQSDSGICNDCECPIEDHTMSYIAYRIVK